MQSGHRLDRVNTFSELLDADFCFYLSFSQIVSRDVLNKFKNNLVVHESDLPFGKGWSPLIWQILEGKNEITTVLFEANEQVDTGQIYLKRILNFNGSELVDELRDIQAAATIEMCKEFIYKYPGVLTGALRQNGGSTFYRKRHKTDSQLDPARSLVEQFNLFRIADNSVYPAYFELAGNFYEVWIKKKSENP